MYFDSTTINFPLPIDAYISTSLCRTSHHFGPMNQFKLHTAQLKYICVCSVGLFGRSWNPNKSINFGLRCASNNFCNKAHWIRFVFRFLFCLLPPQLALTEHDMNPCRCCYCCYYAACQWHGRTYECIAQPSSTEWMDYNEGGWRKASKWKLNNSLHTQIPLFVRI